MRKAVVGALVLLIAPCALHGQATTVDSCKTVALKAPTLWTGAPTTQVNIRTGPGVNYPLHESGYLLPHERVQVLQECHGWLQARVIPVRLIDQAIKENGGKRAREMLLFWVRKDLIQRRQ